MYVNYIEFTQRPEKRPCLVQSPKRLWIQLKQCVYWFWLESQTFFLQIQKDPQWDPQRKLKWKGKVWINKHDKELIDSTATAATRQAESLIHLKSSLEQKWQFKNVLSKLTITKTNHCSCFINCIVICIVSQPMYRCMCLIVMNPKIHNRTNDPVQYLPNTNFVSTCNVCPVTDLSCLYFCVFVNLLISHKPFWI